MSLITPDIINNIASGIIGIGIAVMAFRNKLSNDSNNISKNKAEIDIITALQQQRNDAIAECKSIEEKLEDLKKLYDNTIDENKILKDQIDKDQEHIALLKSRIGILNELINRLTDTIDRASENINKIVNDDKN